MKIEMTKPGNRQYYNEIFYISLKYKKFLKKPNKRVIGIFKDYMIRILFCIFFSLYALICYKIFNSVLFLVFVGYFLFATFLNCILALKIKNQIKYILSSNNKRSIVIDDKKVEYMDLNKTYRNKWENIKYILLNKNSIVFLPASKQSAMIALPITKKKDVLKILKDLNKEDLIRGELYGEN